MHLIPNELVRVTGNVQMVTSNETIHLTLISPSINQDRLITYYICIS